MTKYPGSELELFLRASRWKRYWASRLMPFVKGSVLEVGAGIGGSMGVLANPSITSWHALEPDAELASRIIPPTSYPVTITAGTIDDLSQRFDSILYIDVLEHIEDDEAELRRAAKRLGPRGHLIVLSPAHQFLFSDFDRSIGHFRRYDRLALLTAAPRSLRLVRVEYLDAAGMLGSLANRWLLHKEQPSDRDIEFWDTCMIPLSRILDPVFFRRLGKTVLGIWQSPDMVEG